MGLKTALRPRGTFIYRTAFDNGLTEHELDHVFEGVTDEIPKPDPSEAEGFCFLDIPTIKKMVDEHPGEFTAWFALAIRKFY